MITEFERIIVSRLGADKDLLAHEFNSGDSNIGTRFLVVDDLLPISLADEIYQAFPKNTNRWRQMKSTKEYKYTSKAFDEFPSILKDITFAFQQKSVVALIEDITGIKDQEPDAELYAGGLSMMMRGNFLRPHIDNSHDRNRRKYRTVNLLFYVSPNWSSENGGNLELWDENVVERIEIEAKFNRLVVMETNKLSWHSVNEIKSAASRCCVSNYYFSERSRYDHDYFHITKFAGRPEEHFMQLYLKLDNILRAGIRIFLRRGVSVKDIYESGTDG